MWLSVDSFTSNQAECALSQMLGDISVKRMNKVDLLMIALHCCSLCRIYGIAYQQHFCYLDYLGCFLF